MVDFPTSDSAPLQSSHLPDQQVLPTSYLPFRRISLPSAPNLHHRMSVVSTASFDSVPEAPEAPPLASSPSKAGLRSARHRPSSGEVARRIHRRREVKSMVIDEQRESKRRRVVHELHETERTYVEGLELIHSHFLTPIINTLDTASQLLDRAELTSIFSNFIDIWNLHRSFYASLSTLLSASTSSIDQEIPPLSPVLLAHFPYLSLYTPFISSFPDALSSYSTLTAKNPAFAAFMTTQESDSRCGKLKFQDWLLTIVQRCPRYLLLLKDLINCTHPEDPEHAALTSVHTLVSKITESLNASLQTHSQTLSLLAVQRNTSGLPFALVTPGRTFLKRGALGKLSGSVPKEREFFLFSDCLVWLNNTDRSEEGLWEAIQRESSFTERSVHGTPPLMRTRSKSEAETLHSPTRKRESMMRLKLNGRRKRPSSSGGEERWTYKGHIDLLDLDVVVGPAREAGEQRRLELLSPKKSFALYAATEEERDAWCSAIRNAKASLLCSLNAMNPNTTLTSSSSTNHLRHALQALPYSPQEESRSPKRGKVEHFVPAIWIPDSKTESCMRCGRPFGWRRRRHHCRLCGRCVCSTCSTKTFVIRNANAKGSLKSARACDACYDTVFPIIEQSDSEPEPAQMTISHLTLSGLRSMPSLLLDHNTPMLPSVLMSVDMEEARRPPSRLDLGASPPETPERDVHPVRLKPQSRPRSYIQILEDFGARSDAALDSPTTSRFSERADDRSFMLDVREEDEHELGQRSSGDESPSPSPSAGRHRFRRGHREEPSRMLLSPADALSTSPVQTTMRPSPSLQSPPLRTPRKEDTVRRRKRFSMPAVAIHTTPVTARTNGGGTGEGKTKRWSLVLGNWKGVSSPGGGAGGEDFEEGVGAKQGLAAGKLSELLSRHGKT